MPLASDEALENGPDESDVEFESERLRVESVLLSEGVASGTERPLFRL